MGIDFNGADAHWSYGGFNRFRERLAQMIGLDLNSMKGFAENGAGKEWTSVKDPIKPLLDHSDCDGELSPGECKVVAPRLLELIKDWPDDDYDKQQAIELAKGMAACAKEGKPLEFC